MNDEQPTQSQEAENAPTSVSRNGAVAEAEALETPAAEDTRPVQADDMAGAAQEPTDAPAGEPAEAPTEEQAVEATQERDDQDAQMPGVVDTIGAGEAEPQIMQADETSQAEGELETAAELPGADTVEQAPAVAVPEAPEALQAAEAPEAPEAPQAAEDLEAPIAVADVEGEEADQASEAGEAGEGSEEMVIRSARDPRLEDMAPNASMEDLLKASEQQYRTLKHGDVIEGTVMRLGRDEILVDIGAKTEGIIPSHELQSLSPEEREAMQVGDPVLVSVVQPENNEGHSVLSLDRARQERSWRELQKRFEAGEVIQAKVSGHNKGGLLVNLEGVRGFVPASQISSMPAGEANKQAEMARLQNQTLPLKIIEINRARNRLILSERQAVQEQRESTRTRLLRELEHGQVRPGTVSSICDFGAFVDIGGADGLIHLSELSWKRVSHPSEVLHVGDHINVYVLSVDPNERKIALSLKRTQPEPWTTITENYHLGQIVRGTITQLTTFGAFARLEDGIEGLIHVSELAEGRVAHPKNVVKEGDVLDLKVIRIDPAKRRIGLSLKRVNEDAEGATGAGAAAGAGAEGTEGGDLPVSQTDMTEAYSEEGREAVAMSERQMQEQAQPQQRAPQAQSQQPRQQRQPQPPRQPQQQPRQAQSSPNQEDGEPMGALAQALSAHLRAGEAEEEEEAPTTSPAPVEPKAKAGASAALAEEAAGSDGSRSRPGS